MYLGIDDRKRIFITGDCRGDFRRFTKKHVLDVGQCSRCLYFRLLLRFYVPNKGLFAKEV